MLDSFEKSLPYSFWSLNLNLKLLIANGFKTAKFSVSDYGNSLDVGKKPMPCFRFRQNFNFKMK